MLNIVADSVHISWRISSPGFCPQVKSIQVEWRLLGLKLCVASVPRFPQYGFYQSPPLLVYSTRLSWHLNNVSTFGILFYHQAFADVPTHPPAHASFQQKEHHLLMKLNCCSRCCSWSCVGVRPSSLVLDLSCSAFICLYYYILIHLSHHFAHAHGADVEWAWDMEYRPFQCLPQPITCFFFIPQVGVV